MQECVCDVTVNSVSPLALRSDQLQLHHSLLLLHDRNGLVGEGRSDAERGFKRGRGGLLQSEFTNLN